MMTTTTSSTPPSRASQLQAELEARVEGIDVGKARGDLAKRGVTVIRGVLPPHLVRACVREAEAAKPDAFYSSSKHTPFLVPDDHPAALANPLITSTKVRSSKTCITGRGMSIRSFHLARRKA